MSLVSELERIAELRQMLLKGTARSIRLQAGVSQAEVARTVGVSRAAVSGWELGNRSPRRAEALLYHAALTALLRVLKQLNGTSL